MNNDAIVFSDADDNAWCDSCDALLYEKKDHTLFVPIPSAVEHTWLTL
jgi:hypothetical protein